MVVINLIYAFSVLTITKNYFEWIKLSYGLFRLIFFSCSYNVGSSDAGFWMKEGRFSSYIHCLCLLNLKGNFSISKFTPDREEKNAWKPYKRFDCSVQRMRIKPAASNVFIYCHRGGWSRRLLTTFSMVFSVIQTSISRIINEKPQSFKKTAFGS